MANFDWDPDAYLDSMLSEIPRYTELQDRVAAATEGVAVRNVLELGTGTGETARRVLALHPGAHWTGVDANEAMLSRAREILPASADLHRGRLEDSLPAGPFDLVVSVLAIHHLDRAGKRDLFRRIAAVLRPEGQFVMGDVVVPEQPEDAEIEIWGIDLPDRLDHQLAWLREAGLDVETLWAWKDLAVLRASRRPLRERSRSRTRGRARAGHPRSRGSSR